MKIITKKKQKEAVKRLIANAMIWNDMFVHWDERSEAEREDAHEHFVDNTTEIVATLAGFEGLSALHSKIAK